jgi:hypothetical protein
MRQILFRILARMNRVFLPSYGKRDLTRLSKLDKAIVAYRYWVTTNALG